MRLSLCTGQGVLQHPVTDLLVPGQTSPASHGCNLTIEVAVLLPLYVALTAAHPNRARKLLRRQLCRK